MATARTRSTRPPVRSRARRRALGALAVAAVLPLALTACGSDGDAGRADAADSTPVDAVRASFASALDATSATFTISLRDPDGTLKTALSRKADVAPVADALLGGTVRVTVDPTGDATLREAYAASRGGGVAALLKAADVELVVADADTDLVQVRLVQGVAYATADPDRIDALAAKTGDTSANGFVADALAKNPLAAALAPALADLREGQWLRLDLAPYAGFLGGFGGGALATPSQGGTQLLEALQGATTVTGSGGTYAVEIKAKQALGAVAGMLDGVPGLPDLSSVPDDGVVRATVTTDGDALDEVALDLASLSTLQPAATRSAPLTGATAVIAFDTDDRSITAPEDVSDVDVASLAMQAFARALSGAAGGTPS